MSRVLVTGGSGFVGGHAVARLLAEGHEVRATVRSAGRAAELRARVGATEASPLEIAVADLSGDEGWGDAARGCDFALHVASPFPPGDVADEEALIAPARDGTLRVLRACRDAGVRRVVLTSSFAAVGYGHPPRSAPFTEEDWTQPEGPGVTAYVKSKLFAERAAWAFVEGEGGGLELSVVNPVGIFGPVLGPEVCSSVAIVQKMLSGGMPACPRVAFGVVDVRDGVDLHLRAMTSPAAAGRRYLAVAGESVSMIEVARILRAHLGEGAREAPTRQLPDWVVRALGLFSPELRALVPQLGLLRRASAARAREELGWSPRPNEAVIVATGERLLELGLTGPA